MQLAIDLNGIAERTIIRAASNRFFSADLPNMKAGLTMGRMAAVPQRQYAYNPDLAKKLLAELVIPTVLKQTL